MSDAVLQLHFSETCDGPELVRTRFSAPQLPTPIHGVRGSMTPAGTVPFEWRSGTHALSLFFTRAVEKHLQGDKFCPVLEGFRKAPANTISELLRKGVALWLLDLFGIYATGRPILGRIIYVRKDRYRRDSCVHLYLRETVLAPSNIHIFLDGSEISTDADRISALAEKLLATWSPYGGLPRLSVSHGMNTQVMNGQETVRS